MLDKLHARLGDFWWYSLMLFCACRAADLLNAFVGLWLVPKYVDPSELGAVMPLTNFANFLAMPIAAFANTFRNELTRLSINSEFGKLKTLMRGVFIATAIFLFIAIVIAHFTLPLFLERIRIVEGSLGLIIIAASFVSAISPVYSNALQTLKKFKEYSVINIIGAPVRLLTMLVAMPFRALTGYFIGQAATPAFTMAASVFVLKKELSAQAEPYWSTVTFKKFSTILAIFFAFGSSTGLYALVESMVLRQRLPDLDSAGYYMATRFSEIASYLNGALCFTIFPFTAELAKNRHNDISMLLKATVVNMAFCSILAVFFFFAGRPLLALLPHGNDYVAYWWAIPWMILIMAIHAFISLFITVRFSESRFGFMKWMIPFDLAGSALLLLITGYGYYAHLLPVTFAKFLDTHNIKTLGAMFWWLTAFLLLKAIFCIASLRTRAHIELHSRETRNP